jgi:competence protein ComEC
VRLWPIIILLALVTRLPALNNRFYSNDEATYSALAARVAAGGTMYADAVDHKPPGIVSTYAAIFRVAGVYRLAAVRVALIFVVALTGILVGELAAGVAGNPAARLAGVLYVLASATGFPDNVQAANTELFLNLPLVAASIAVVAAHSAGSAKRALLLSLAAGALTGAAALFKYQAAIAGLAWLWFAFRARRRPGVAIAMAAGLAVGFGAVAFALLRHYASAGRLDAFLFWGWRYNFAYIASMPLARQMARALVRTTAIALWWAPLVVLAWRRRCVDGTVVWLAVMGIAVATGGRYFGNYYLMLLPPLAVLAARREVPRRFLVATGALAAVSVALAVFWLPLRPALRDEDARYRAVGGWLLEHSSPDDTIFVWGDSAQVYVYSRRLMGPRFAFANYHTGKIWGTGADETDAATREDLVVPRAWKELDDDFRHAPPRFVVDAAAGGLHGFAGDALKKYPAIWPEIESNYRLVSTVAGVPIYQRAAAGASPRTLDIYFIDVEGGQSTLVVSPDKQSLLIDAGYAGNDGRDRDRVLAAVRDAGLSRIDYLLVTHFHSDHVGGVPDVASRLPIGTFVDYGEPSGADENALPPFKAYASARQKGAHLVPKPGDRLPLTSADVRVVSAGGTVVSKPLPGGGAANAACAAYSRRADDPSENARSLGVLVAFGRFRFLDLGDLNWNPLGRLVCPTNLLGAVDLFLLPHHTNDDAAVPAMLTALAPRVVVSNNGPTKGGTAGAMKLVHQLTNTDVWQLHKSRSDGATNSDDRLLANVDDGKSGYWIKVSATADGRFTVTNARTGDARTYK